jgi:fructose-1,6-bisphosphatase/inositol monophosphatase family enzyme
LLGAFAIPCLDQEFWAASGRGAYLNGERVSVLRGDELKRNDVLMISSPHIPEWDFMGNIKYRIAGSAAYAMNLVAAGVAIGMVSAHWHSWDAGAAFCLLKEAGAIATDVHGNDLYNILKWDYTGSGPCMITASPEYHALLMEHIDPDAV